MKVWIRTVDLYRFVPDDRGRADGRAPVEFDKGRFAIGVDEPEGMDPEPSIILSDRGMVRSDMIHRTMFMLSGKSEIKSQNVSCAVASWG